MGEPLPGVDGLLEAAHARTGPGDEEQRSGADLDHGREAIEHVVAVARAQLEHQLGHGKGIGRQQQRVAIGRCLGNETAAYGAAGARAVVHEHGLADAGRQLLAQQSRQRVGIAACGVGHDDGDRLVGVGLGLRRTGEQRQGHGHGRAQGERSAFRFHGEGFHRGFFIVSKDRCRAQAWRIATRCIRRAAGW